MKTKVITFAIAILLSGSACFSQPGPGGMKPPTIQERLKMVDEKISQPLNLNKVQKEKVASAFQEFFVEMDKLMDPKTFPPAMPEKAKVEPLEKIRNNKVKLALPETLFAKYLELELSTRPKDPCEGRQRPD